MLFVNSKSGRCSRPFSFQRCMQYLAIVDRAIPGIDCNRKHGNLPTRIRTGKFPAVLPHAKTICHFTSK